MAHACSRRRHGPPGRSSTSPIARATRWTRYHPRTFRVVRRLRVGGLPQHVVPGYALGTLYVTNDMGNSLTSIDPRTGRREATSRSPTRTTCTSRRTAATRSWLPSASTGSTSAHCPASTLSLGCSAVCRRRPPRLLGRRRVRARELRVLARAGQDRHRKAGGRIAACRCRPTLMPQDVKLAPDGGLFYVADSHANGVWEVDGNAMRVTGFIRDRARRPRPVRESQRQAAVRHEQVRRIGLPRQLQDQKAGREMASPRRRQPRYGQRVGRRQGALALGSLRRRRLCDQHEEWEAPGQDPRRRGTHGSASGHNRGATRSGTQGSCAKGRWSK